MYSRYTCPVHAPARLSTNTVVVGHVGGDLGDEARRAARGVDLVEAREEDAGLGLRVGRCLGREWAEASGDHPQRAGRVEGEPTGGHAATCGAEGADHARGAVAGRGRVGVVGEQVVVRAVDAVERAVGAEREISGADPHVGGDFAQLSAGQVDAGERALSPESRPPSWTNAPGAAAAGPAPSAANAVQVNPTTVRITTIRRISPLRPNLGILLATTGAAAGRDVGPALDRRGTFDPGPARPCSRECKEGGAKDESDEPSRRNDEGRRRLRVDVRQHPPGRRRDRAGDRGRRQRGLGAAGRGAPMSQRWPTRDSSSWVAPPTCTV